MTNYSIHKLQPVNAHLTEQLRAYAYDVTGCCQVVHRDMGPFLNEYMYQEALAIELSLRGIPFQRGLQRKPNEVFAMGRAGSSEYFLPKRNFGTCTRIDHAIGQGRTVLFVSHNMASAIQPLCKKRVLLENGMKESYRKAA